MAKSKYLAFGLSALLALSLASCGGQQAQKPQEPQEVQQAEPISTQPVVAPVEVKREVVPAAAPETVLEEGRSVQDGDTSGEIDDTGEIEPVELFTDVEETVYATGTVNIRSSWSVESEKLGSLGKGDSVIRTGIAIEGTEAEGWSRVKISDGQAEDGTEQFKIVYISNKYLSTTKPTQAQASKPSGGQQQTQQTQQTQSSGSQQQTQQSTSSSSTQKIDGHDDLGDYVLNGKGGKYYPALGVTLPVSYNGKTHEGIDFSTPEGYDEAMEKTYKAMNESSAHHTESWKGVTMGG